jgi:hypothetical protein
MARETGEGREVRKSLFDRNGSDMLKTRRQWTVEGRELHAQAAFSRKALRQSGKTVKE